jgi:hypothetical protein
MEPDAVENVIHASPVLCLHAVGFRGVGHQEWEEELAAGF